MLKILLSLLVFCSLSAEKVILETNEGTIELTLWKEIAPKTVENFTTLVNQGYYNGTTFHRVIKGFMLQGGDPTATGAGGRSIYGPTFADEFKPNVNFDRPYLLAMANRGPNTNGSQFFITTSTPAWLNQKHTIFGEVTQGKDVVDKIENTPKGPGDKPLTPQVIQKASVVQE
jgi:peptidylprolyl isomerase